MKYAGVYLTIIALLMALPVRCVSAANIDPSANGSRYVWGENIGWINLAPDFGPGVTVTDTTVTGMAWGENIGWINLNPTGGGITNDGTGALSGFAWSENSGWIDFSPFWGGVSINACGEFNGTAYGENIGWISFRSDSMVNPFKAVSSWVSSVDTVPPVTTFTPPLQSWFNTDVLFTFSATDCGSGVKEIRTQLDQDLEVVTPGATAQVTVSQEGIHSFSYTTEDNAGNVEFRPLEIAIDKTPPDITITVPPDNAVYTINSAVTPVYTITDAISGVVGYSLDVMNTNLAGSHTFTVWASDYAGNPSSLTHAYAVVYPGNVDPGSTGCQYAWGENIGWIDFKPAWGPGVTVTDTAVTGMAWGENIGWIDLSPTNSGVVNDGKGNLSGSAWSENTGWISFNPPGGGVTIAQDGSFSGNAWGENIGWVSFGVNNTCLKSTWVAPVYHSLAVNLSGTGSGTIESTTPGASFTCSADCVQNYPANTALTLTPKPASTSYFSGWSGACTNIVGDCQVTLDTDRTVTAMFTLLPPLRLLIGTTPSYVTPVTLQNAYDTAPGGATIQLMSNAAPGPLEAGINKVVRLTGGYDSSFTTQNSRTIINGPLRIRSGKIIVNSIAVNKIIQQPATPIDSTTFFSLVSQGTLKVVDSAAEKLQQEAKDAANIQLVANFFATHPGNTFLSDPANLIPRTTATPIKPSGSGEFLLSYTDARGQSQTVMTLGLSSIYEALASGIETVPSYRNQIGLYTALYSSLREYNIPLYDPLSNNLIPAPGVLTNFPADQIRTYNDLIVGSLADIRARLPQFNPGFSRPLNCSDELGAAPDNMAIGDRTDIGLGLSPNGIVGLNSFSFPLKNFVTCVKNQRSRGTCHSFATVAALEETYAKKNHLWVNLSEQDLMNQYRLWWYPNNSLEGGNPWDELTSLRDTGYHLSFEYGWTYNPSIYRGSFFGTFYDSCINYPETCSNSTHQGHEYSTITEGGGVGYAFSSPIIGTNDRLAFTPQSLVNFWDVSQPDLSAAYMQLHLIFGHPVVISMLLPDEFSKPDANGFVTLAPGTTQNPSEPSNTGGHAVNVIGYITNEELISRLPKAPLGSGGGYFIVKNSWGLGFGDSGFVYLPWNLVRYYTLQGVAITD